MTTTHSIRDMLVLALRGSESVFRSGVESFASLAFLPGGISPLLGPFLPWIFCRESSSICAPRLLVLCDCVRPPEADLFLPDFEVL